MNGPIGDSIMDKMPFDVQEACSVIFKLQKIDFKENHTALVICGELRKKFEEYRPYLPLVHALKNPNLMPRHYEIIRKLKDPEFEIYHDLQKSISDLCKIGVMDIIEEIAEVSDIASREKKLEDQIQKMHAEWKNLKFEMQEHKGSGTLILIEI